MRLADFVPKRKMSLFEAAALAAISSCGEVFAWGLVFLLGFLGKTIGFMGLAIFILGVAALLCMASLIALDKALDDPNDNPRANRLTGRRRGRGSYDYRDQTDRIPHPRAAAPSIAIIGAFLFVASVGIVIANYPLHKAALVPATKLPATIDATRDTDAAFTQRGSWLIAKCEILFPKGQGAVPGVNCQKSGGDDSDLLNKTK